MEDAHAAVLDLDGSEENSNAFFAVYDGHGGMFLCPRRFLTSSQFPWLGSAVAKFAGKNLHKRLVGEEAYKERNWEVALKKAFLGTDEDLIASKSHLESIISKETYLWKADLKEPSGSTAIAALVTNDSKIYVVSPVERPRSSLSQTLAQANAGDSRSVISVNGRVKSLSFDHKPTDQGQYLHIYLSVPRQSYFFFLQRRGHASYKRVDLLKIVGWMVCGFQNAHCSNDVNFFFQEISPCHAH